MRVVHKGRHMQNMSCVVARSVMIWWEFIEAVGTLAAFHVKNPYTPIEKKVP